MKAFESSWLWWIDTGSLQLKRTVIELEESLYYMKRILKSIKRENALEVFASRKDCCSIKLKPLNAERFFFIYIIKASQTPLKRFLRRALNTANS
jgi:hypothetical protein